MGAARMTFGEKLPKAKLPRTAPGYPSIVI